MAALSTKMAPTQAATCSRRAALCPSLKASRPVAHSSSRAEKLARRGQRQVTVAAASAAPVYEREREELSSVAQDPEILNLPHGYHWYETMLVLTPTLNDEERDKELAKFEAFLNKEGCSNISALVRGRSRMAYPIKTNWEGIYVLYTYAAKRQTARTVQLLLSNPEAGSEDKLLRHITFCKY